MTDPAPSVMEKGSRPLAREESKTCPVDCSLPCIRHTQLFLCLNSAYDMIRNVLYSVVLCVCVDYARAVFILCSELSVCLLLQQQPSNHLEHSADIEK